MAYNSVWVSYYFITAFYLPMGFVYLLLVWFPSNYGIALVVSLSGWSWCVYYFHHFSCCIFFGLALHFSKTRQSQFFYRLANMNACIHDWPWICQLATSDPVSTFCRHMWRVGVTWNFASSGTSHLPVQSGHTCEITKRVRHFVNKRWK